MYYRIRVTATVDACDNGGGARLSDITDPPDLHAWCLAIVYSNNNQSNCVRKRLHVWHRRMTASVAYGQSTLMRISSRHTQLRVKFDVKYSLAKYLHLDARVGGSKYTLYEKRL